MIASEKSHANRFHYLIQRTSLISKIVRVVLLAVYLSATGVALMGCNTVEGAGKDIENGGDAIKDAARDAKN